MGDGLACPAAASSEDANGTIQVYAPVLDEPTAEEAPEAAVEPDAAKAELTKPADASASGGATVDATTPAASAEAGAATTTEAPAGTTVEGDATAKPADPAAPVTECPEGQKIVDGKCVPRPRIGCVRHFERRSG